MEQDPTQEFKDPEVIAEATQEAPASITEVVPIKTGRPSSYTQEIADKICHELATGKSLRTVCAPDDMPAISTIFNWFRAYPEFLEQYARAKQESADAMGEDILDIADETISVIKKGAEKKSSALAQAQRLRVDTRKWLMSKHKPKKYGEKLDLTTDGEKLPTPIYGGLSTQNKGHDSNAQNIPTIKKD
jgi:hypothetical protein